MASCWSINAAATTSPALPVSEELANRALDVQERNPWQLLKLRSRLIFEVAVSFRPIAFLGVLLRTPNEV
jgi:hypothetical protein